MKTSKKRVKTSTFDANPGVAIRLQKSCCNREMYAIQDCLKIQLPVKQPGWVNRISMAEPEKASLPPENPIFSIKPRVHFI